MIFKDNHNKFHYNWINALISYTLADYEDTPSFVRYRLMMADQIDQHERREVLLELNGRK